MLKLIEVTWEDASNSMKVYSQDNVSKRKGLYLLKTVGYLIHEDKTRIALAMQVDEKTNDVRMLTWIPIGMIKSRRELK